MDIDFREYYTPLFGRWWTSPFITRVGTLRGNEREVRVVVVISLKNVQIMNNGIMYYFQI